VLVFFFLPRFPGSFPFTSYFAEGEEHFGVITLSHFVVRFVSRKKMSDSGSKKERQVSREYCPHQSYNKRSVLPQRSLCNFFVINRWTSTWPNGIANQLNSTFLSGQFVLIEYSIQGGHWLKLYHNTAYQSWFSWPTSFSSPFSQRSSSWPEAYLSWLAFFWSCRLPGETNWNKLYSGQFWTFDYPL
jgi:hypothetical protein